MRCILSHGTTAILRKTRRVPNNSFNPTAGVGLVTNNQLGPAAG